MFVLDLCLKGLESLPGMMDEGPACDGGRALKLGGGSERRSWGVGGLGDGVEMGGRRVEGLRRAKGPDHGALEMSSIFCCRPFAAGCQACPSARCTPGIASCAASSRDRFSV